MTHVDDFYKVDCDGVTRTLESGGWAASAGKLTWVCVRERGGGKPNILSLIMIILSTCCMMHAVREALPNQIGWIFTLFPITAFDPLPTP